MCRDKWTLFRPNQSIGGLMWVKDEFRKFILKSKLEMIIL